MEGKKREPPGKGDGKRERVKKQRGQLQRGCVCVSHQLDSHIITPPYYVYNPVTHLLAPSSCYPAVYLSALHSTVTDHFDITYFLSTILFFMKDDGSCDHLCERCFVLLELKSFHLDKSDKTRTLCNLWYTVFVSFFYSEYDIKWDVYKACVCVLVEYI